MTTRFPAVARLLLAALLCLPAVPLAAQQAGSEQAELTEGAHEFRFDGWRGPALKVHAFIPTSVAAEEAPILVVMHGMNRDADRYLAQWQGIAQERSFIVIVPEFGRGSFRGSHEYHLGHVVKRGRTDLRERSEWSFAAIEPLFDHVVARIGGKQEGYTLYGHSAGSQFVHRFMLTQRNPRVLRYILANAGWYTLPTFAFPYPNGLNGLDLVPDDLRSALASDVVVLLGEEDTDPRHESLNRSEEAMRQGEHRLARGKFFFEFGREMARRQNWAFNWTLRTVPGVAHDNGGMAQAAGELVVRRGSKKGN